MIFLSRCDPLVWGFLTALMSLKDITGLQGVLVCRAKDAIVSKSEGVTESEKKNE